MEANNPLLKDDSLSKDGLLEKEHLISKAGIKAKRLTDKKADDLSDDLRGDFRRIQSENKNLPLNIKIVK